MISKQKRSLKKQLRKQKTLKKKLKRNQRGGAQISEQMIREKFPNFDMVYYEVNENDVDDAEELLNFIRSEGPSDEEKETKIREIAKKYGIADEYEIEIEEECLKILALHQPVAVDLRYIISIMKINNS